MTATNVTGEAKRKPKLAPEAANKPMDALRPDAAKSISNRLQHFVSMTRWLFIEGPGAVQMTRWAKTASEAEQAKAAELLEHIHAANQLAEELQNTATETKK